MPFLHFIILLILKLILWWNSSLILVKITSLFWLWFSMLLHFLLQLLCIHCLSLLFLFLVNILLMLPASTFLSSLLFYKLWISIASLFISRSCLVLCSVIIKTMLESLYLLWQLVLIIMISTYFTFYFNQHLTIFLLDLFYFLL